MCFSSAVNYRSWLISLIGAIILLIQGTTQNSIPFDNIWIAIFTLVVTQIQVLESMIWTNIENNNHDKANSMMKYFVPLLWTQPLINIILAYIATKNKILIPLILFYLITIIYDTNNAFTCDKFNFSLSKSKHLVWNRFQNEIQVSIVGNKLFSIMYLIGLIAPLYFISDLKLRITLILFGILSFIIIKYLYGENFESMWCFVSIGFIYMALITKFVGH
jgi:hypothetical protein